MNAEEFAELLKGLGAGIGFIAAVMSPFWIAGLACLFGKSDKR